MAMPPPQTPRKIPCVLTIAGSDSGGGAGIQADIKTLTSLGVYSASVVTALTAQNTLGVQGVHIPPPSVIAQQLDSVLSDLDVSASKTGMLPTPPIIRAVAAAIRQSGVSAVVVDPVLVATSGDTLVHSDCKAALMHELFPLASVVTPNVPEAEALTGSRISTDHDVRAACVELAKTGCKSVLLKGGHWGGGVATDVLYDGEEFEAFVRPRVESKHTHGTGCSLASAVAGGLACGWGVRKAVEVGKEFVYRGIVGGLQVGKGNGPLNHMHSIQRFDPI